MTTRQVKGGGSLHMRQMKNVFIRLRVNTEKESTRTHVNCETLSTLKDVCTG